MDEAAVSEGGLQPSDRPDDDGHRRAQVVAEALWQADRAARRLGMQVLTVGPASSSVQMAVRDDMLNGLGSCHGGVIATLADTAFGFACNAGNEATVASGFDIDFLAAARLGDVLTAQAHEVSRANRTGLYDVRVSNQHGQTVAVFRGRSYGLRGRAVVPGLPVGRS